VGTTVFGGMIAATTLNLLFIPVLYVIVKSIFPGTTANTAAAKH
jgi:multidrug efflux pump